MKTTLKFLAIALFSTTMFFSAQATIWTIEASNFIFTPDNLSDVVVGDTIHWIWIEGSHTTTSSDIPAGADPWDELLTSGNTSYDYVPMVPGTYDYVCTPHASFGMVGSFTVSTASDIDQSLAPSITIAPNPVVDQLLVGSGTGETVMIKHLRIFNVKGELVYASENGVAPFLSGKIDMSQQKAGIYFVEIIDRNGKAIRQKMIKK